jgi:predicted Rossmann-fold nucleotide-binding protein
MKTKVVIKKVAFLGDADAKRYQLHWRSAYKIAKLLAENGFDIVNGGGPGVMLASTLGAKAANGRVELVIIPKENEPDSFEGSHKRNLALADKIYYEKDYHNRLSKIVAISDAFVIFKGGTGTISEVGLTWELAKFDYKKGIVEPLVFYGKAWENIIKQMKKSLPLTKDETSVYSIAKKPEDVLKFLTKVSAEN